MFLTVLIFFAYFILTIFIIFKAFCNNDFSLKYLYINIQIESLPFYYNKEKINLFSFFIYFLLIIIFNFIFIQDSLLNNITYCASDLESVSQNIIETHSDLSSSDISFSDDDYIIDMNAGFDVTNHYHPLNHHVWYKNAELISNNFTDRIFNLDEPKIEFIKEREFNFLNIMDLLPLYIQEEAVLKTEFDELIRIKESQLTSHLLKVCHDCFSVSLKKTNEFLINFFNSEQSKSEELYNSSDLEKIRDLYKINNDILSNMNNILETYNWSDNNSFISDDADMKIDD